MRYMVLLREQASGTYVAMAPAVPTCKAEGRTRDEALERLRAVLEDWLAGTEITTIDVAVPGAADGREQNPWLATAGIFADDPTLGSMLSEIYEARDAEQATE